MISGPTGRTTMVAVAAILVAGALLVGMWLLFSETDPASVPEQQDRHDRLAERDADVGPEDGSPYQPAAAGIGDRDQDDRPGPQENGGKEDAGGEEDGPSQRGAENGDSEESDEPVQPHLHEEGPEGVGPVRWMAPAEDVNFERMEEQFDDMERRQKLAMRDDRRRSIRAVDDAVDDCEPEVDHDRPDVRRRLALEWTMITEGGVGTVKSPRVLQRLGGEDERLEQCLLERIDGLQFDAGGDEGDALVHWVYRR